MAAGLLRPQNLPHLLQSETSSNIERKSVSVVFIILITLSRTYNDASFLITD